MDSLIIFLAKDLFIFVILIWIGCFFYTPKNRRLEYIVALIVAAIIALILDKVAGALYYHPRPFSVNHIKPLISHGADNGFPSEHTILVMTITTLIYFYRRQLALLAFTITVLVGAGRVWSHVHSWQDIAGGILIGLIAGYAGYKIARMLMQNQLLNRVAGIKRRTNARRPTDHH
ncbi:MAG TPA: phosphatase PAP2 family protein [Candidatus Saccharimonadales bacterium]|nr:phosphatase PAP2 family protein [Candidatus Saccharimonadales bacterium]